MNLIRAVNISMELWGCLLSLLIAIYILQEKKPLRPRSRAFLLIVLCQALLLLGDAMGFSFEGDPAYLNYCVVSVGNFLVFALGYVLLVLFTQYLTAYLSESGPVSRVPLYITRTLAVIAVGLVILSQFNHMYYVINADSVYVRQDMFWLSQAFGILGMCVNAVFLLLYHKRIDSKDRIVLWLYILLPVAAMAVQLFIYGPALLNLANTFCLIVIFLFIQMNHVRHVILQEQTISQQTAELSHSQAKLVQTRMDLMRSQIQPHFIYNTLGTISVLCLTQPQKAAEIVQEFSQYLRGNFDDLEINSPIRLSREIEHVKHYTAIEHVRFPDMDIRYDLRSDEFFLPALSIQPLVENSIKHGLMGLEHGGSVVISTYETATAYCVCVKDNGVGFDPTTPLSPYGRRHLGIANIRERIEIMCGGTLTIDSVPGLGTTALISIPKEDMT